MRAQGRNSATTRGIAITLAALAAAGCAKDRRDIHAANHERALDPSGVTVQSWPLCALVGPQSGKAGVFGTDLGYTVREPNRGPGDRLAIFFGDTWAENEAKDCRFPRLPSDDLAGWLPATRPPAFSAGPPPANAPTGCGLLETPREDATEASTWPPLRLFENEEAARDGEPLETTALKTPLSAFSDGEKMYAFFGRNEPAYCGTGGDCPKGLECSTDPAFNGRNLGVCAGERAPRPGLTPTWCRDAMDCAPGLSCRLAEKGTCLETEPFRVQTRRGPIAPPWYKNDPRKAVAHPVYLAVRAEGDRPMDYVVRHRFVTQRFISLTARTVARFDPEDPAHDDYSPGHHTLFVWGRPWWVGFDGTQSLPFLFHVPLEELARGVFRPRYFGGYGPSGRPLWVDNEGDAQPVYGAEGTLDEKDERILWREPEFDYVNAMSVLWLAPLGRWLMAYGGDLPAALVKDARTRSVIEPTYVQRSPGAIHFRVAKAPWGRPHGGRPREEGWSSFEPLLTRRDAAPYMACGEGGESVMPGCLRDATAARPEPNARTPNASTPAAASGNAEPRGRESTLAPKCIAGDVGLSLQEGRSMSGNAIGRLYAPNFIEEWTEDVTAKVGGLAPGERAVEIYFNASTWNPYQVVLFKAQVRGTAHP